MNAMNLFFSFKGRISRKPFWLGLVAVMILALVIGLVSAAMIAISANNGSVSVGGILVGLLALPLIYPILAIHAKRWHDHDCTGWKAITLIQGIGGAWDAIQVAFYRGTPGPNRFGPDPLADIASSYYAQPVYTRTAAS